MDFAGGSGALVSGIETSLAGQPVLIPVIAASNPLLIDVPDNKELSN